MTDQTPAEPLSAAAQASPDPRRPGWRDSRVVEARCGLVIALVGLRENRPPALGPCAECVRG